jgi:hypothetical protein
MLKKVWLISFCLFFLFASLAFADYGKTYDLTATTTDWILGSTISAMADDNISNVVFIGTSDGKLGYYNKTSNTSTDLTALITGWVGATDIFSMDFDYKDNRLYFTAGALFGYYDMNTGSAFQIFDIFAQYTLIDYDGDNDYLWFISNDGTFGFYEIYGDVKNLITITLPASAGCVKYNPIRQEVYVLYISGTAFDYGYPRVFHISNSTFTDLSGIIIPNVYSCDLDVAGQVLYVGQSDCGTYSGFYDITTSLYSNVFSGDLVVPSVTFMPSNNKSFFALQQCWDGEPYGWIYNKLMNSSIYIENTDVGNWMVGQQLRKSAYNPNQRNLYVGLSAGGFGYYDNCLPSWTAYYSYCGIDNTAYKYYVDTHSCGTTQNLPFDNGSLTSCNYCSENIVATYGACVSNGSNSIQQLTYTDLNYDTCCAVTGLGSDCDILSSPYNETYVINCSTLADDFEISYDTSCDMGVMFDKCYWNIDLNRTNTTFNCMSYVLTNETKLIQSNPVYTQKTNPLIQLTRTDYEDREYFSIQNGIGQIYFTKENLVFDGRDYTFGVKCADNNEVLSSERIVQVGYENINAPTTRAIWAQGQISPLILIIIGLIIVIITLAILIKIWKGR